MYLILLVASELQNCVSQISKNTPTMESQLRIDSAIRAHLFKIILSLSMFYFMGTKSIHDNYKSSLRFLVHVMLSFLIKTTYMYGHLYLKLLKYSSGYNIAF